MRVRCVLHEKLSITWPSCCPRPKKHSNNHVLSCICSQRLDWIGLDLQQCQSRHSSVVILFVQSSLPCNLSELLKHYHPTLTLSVTGSSFRSPLLFLTLPCCVYLETFLLLLCLSIDAAPLATHPPCRAISGPLAVFCTRSAVDGMLSRQQT